ncbi:MAG: hypothetical protein HY738_13685 [Bacteroidia bacterium]|nr:hypothetical protein [Bacteroidia bacterium]
MNRIKNFFPKYKVDINTFEILNGLDGEPLLDEDFTQTIFKFKKWCLGQENILQNIFIKTK